MILTCPNCHSQFKVAKEAIPEDGREVRCASCQHQWHAYPEGEVGELTAPEPTPDEAGDAADEVEKLIAYPDPEPIEPPEPEPEEPALPEDAFKGDADTWQDESEYPMDGLIAVDEEMLRSDPQLVSPIEDESFNSDEPRFAQPQQAPKASLTPLIAVAVCLLLAIAASSFFAMPTLFGQSIGEQLVLSDVRLRERPARTKARYIIEGVIVNTSDETLDVPTLRIALVDKEGELMQSREYEDATKPVIAPGESYAFKASNLETRYKDKLMWFVVDIGSGAELRMRKPVHALPEVASMDEPNG